MYRFVVVVLQKRVIVLDAASLEQTFIIRSKTHSVYCIVIKWAGSKISITGGVISQHVHVYTYRSIYIYMYVYVYLHCIFTCTLLYCICTCICVCFLAGYISSDSWTNPIALGIRWLAITDTMVRVTYTTHYLCLLMYCIISFRYISIYCLWVELQSS